MSQGLATRATTPEPALLGAARPSAAAPARTPVESLLTPLLILFFVSILVPDPVHIVLGGDLQLTPRRIVSLPLVFALLMAPMRWSVVDWWVPVIFGTQFVSGLVEDDVVRVMEGQVRAFLDMGVPYFVGRYITVRLVDYRAVQRWSVAVLGGLSLFVAVEAVFRVNVYHEFWSLAGYSMDVHWEDRMGFRRAAGFTTHPIMLGLTYSTLLPLALDEHKRRGGWTLLWVVGFFMAIFFSLSSGAYIATGVVLGLWGYERWCPARDRWGWFYLLTPVLYMVGETLTNRPLLRIAMMKLHLSSPTAWYFRWKLIERSKASLEGHWAWGRGYCSRGLPEEFGSMTSIDNHYLMVMVKFGLVGLAVWVGFMIHVLLGKFSAVWGMTSNPTVRTARWIGFGLLSLAVTQFSVALFSSAATICWLLMGVFVGLAWHCRYNPEADVAAADTGAAS